MPLTEQEINRFCACGFCRGVGSITEGDQYGTWTIECSICKGEKLDRSKVEELTRLIEREVDARSNDRG